MRRTLTNSWLVIVLISSAPAFATSYVYSAVCKNSYSKQGDQEEDLTKRPGKPIRCDSVVLSLLDNGHVMVQISERVGKLTPLGFAGVGLGYESNPNFITLPLRSIYVPHSTASGSRPEVIEGVEGFCFLEGRANIRSLTAITCATRVQLGTERLVYHIEAAITGTGKAAP